MSKYIDVAEGDVFGADASLCQMRGSMFRNFEVGGVTGWLKSGKHTDNTALRPVSRKDAELMIRMAGYTITTPAAKDEAPAKTVMGFCNKCGYSGPCVEERGIFKHDPQNGRTCSYSAVPFDSEAPAKTEPTPDDLAATVKRVNDLTKIVHGLQDSMPGYDKDVTADEAFRRLDERLSKLEAATTPAKVRVVAPTVHPQTDTNTNWYHGWKHADEQWRRAAKDAGIDVVKEAGK